jgi:hypothetical protein
VITLKVSFNSRKVIAELSNDVDQMIRQVSQDLFDTVKEKTPVRSGRAKRGWRLRKQRQHHYEVANRVPYVSRLDEGYSKQAPRGMTRPAAREVLNRARRRFRNV